MITETEARELLTRAAGTIEVPPGGAAPLSSRRRSPWVGPLLAAAAVLVALAAGIKLVHHGSELAPQPTQQAPAPQMPKDRIPSVFTQDKNSAVELLEERGLTVVVHPMKPACGVGGRADHTSPAAGSRFRPGQRVTLFVTTATEGLCGDIGEFRAWQLLDFAGRRGQSPRFAPWVQSYVNGEHTELTGAQASDRDTWGDSSALGALARLIDSTDLPGSQFSSPSMHVSYGRPRSCNRRSSNEGAPRQFRYRDAYRIDFVVSTIGSVNVCYTVDLFLDSQDRIDTILVEVPDLFVHPPAPDPTPDGDHVAAGFVGFARGTADAPSFSGQVRLYLGNSLQERLSAQQAQNRSVYRLCASYAERTCPMSAVSILKDRTGIAQAESADSCLQQLAPPLEPKQTHAFHHVTWGAAKPRTCADDWAVQVWYDGASRITAVNLLLGGP